MEPNAYTFATAVSKKVGCSYHEGVILWYLAFMPSDVQKAYGEGKLSGEDVRRIADKLELPCTRVYNAKEKGSYTLRVMGSRARVKALGWLKRWEGGGALVEV